MFTGNSLKFDVQALDRYGNTVPTFDVTWAVQDGKISPNGGYTAGRRAGAFQVTASVDDGRAIAVTSIPVTVEQGYCETRTARSVWKFEWYAYEDGTLGNLLGSSEHAANLHFDWGFGPVFVGREGKVRLEARATIVVQRQGPVLFTIGGDDGLRLFINGTEIISDWSTHSYREHSRTVMLEPGVYELTLDYFEWTGLAELSFRADGDVLQWAETTQCFGGFVEAPDVRYFVHHPSEETPNQVATRFGLANPEVTELNREPFAPLLLPGTRTQGTKVIVIQGIDSRSFCAGAEEGLEVLFAAQEKTKPALRRMRTEPSLDDTLLLRRHTLLRAIQTRLGEGTGEVSLIDDGDIIGFSYSGRYRNCITGEPYTAETFPAAMSFRYPPFAVTIPPLPEYLPSSTCNGVEEAAGKLGTLVNRSIRLDPNSTFILIGHSMAGLVAAYYVSQLSPDFLSERIQAVVTLDSPLKGIEADPPLVSLLQHRSKLAGPPWVHRYSRCYSEDGQLGPK